MMLTTLGRLLILVGVTLFLRGLLLQFSRLPWAGRLPGDIVVKRDDLALCAPLGTMLLVSIVMSLASNLFFRLLR
jgi:Protein of unknown function (DUF2905)